MNTAILIFALLGLLASLVVHVSTYICTDVPREAWILLLIFFIPLELLAHGFKRKRYKGIFFPYLSFIFRNIPKDLMPFLIGWLIYVVFTILFSVIVLNKGGVPANMYGNLVLQSHGTIIKELSQQEFALHMT